MVQDEKQDHTLEKFDDTLNMLGDVRVCEEGPT